MINKNYNIHSIFTIALMGIALVVTAWVCPTGTMADEDEASKAESTAAAETPAEAAPTPPASVLPTAPADASPTQLLVYPQSIDLTTGRGLSIRCCPTGLFQWHYD